MSLPYKIGIVGLLLAAIFIAGYWHGQRAGREAALKAAVQAYQMRGQINDKVQNLDPVALCRALGGLQHECAALMRGMDTSARD